MFERFTDGTRAVVVEAHDLALELGSDSIGAGHLLYGCAESREETAGGPLNACGITPAAIRRLLPRVDLQPTGHVDAESLRAIGIEYQAVRAAVEETFGPGAPFTPEAKQSLKLALRVAVELHANSIVPGHLLLGLLRLDDELVSNVIAQSGTTVAGLSAAVLSGVSGAP
jgi:ATP-dependent Clp protease ATP-binding subunit ClpA